MSEESVDLFSDKNSLPKKIATLLVVSIIGIVVFVVLLSVIGVSVAIPQSIGLIEIVNGIGTVLSIIVSAFLLLLYWDMSQTQSIQAKSSSKQSEIMARQQHIMEMEFKPEVISHGGTVSGDTLVISLSNTGATASGLRLEVHIESAEPPYSTSEEIVRMRRPKVRAMADPFTAILPQGETEPVAYRADIALALKKEQEEYDTRTRLSFSDAVDKMVDDGVEILFLNIIARYKNKLGEDGSTIILRHKARIQKGMDLEKFLEADSVAHAPQNLDELSGIEFKTRKKDK